MSFDCLRDSLSSLESLRDLKRIKAPVDPVHEFGAVLIIRY
jgi:3-polyprenyl-4-hydroxybenzoate decarboxylase